MKYRFDNIENDIETMQNRIVNLESRSRDNIATSTIQSSPHMDGNVELGRSLGTGQMHSTPHGSEKKYFPGGSETNNRNTGILI